VPTLAPGYFTHHILIQGFTKYFGVCSGNSPVMPEKNRSLYKKLFHVKQLQEGSIARPNVTVQPLKQLIFNF
jgi:hypothetical protein